MGVEGWKVQRVRELSYINKESLTKKDNVEYINYLDTANLTEGKIENIQKLIVQDDSIPSRAKRIIRQNDILISTVRPDQKHYGIIRKPVKNMIASTGFTVLTAITDKVNAYYLYKYLTQDEITQKLQAIAETTTSTYPSIKPSDIGELEIDMPTLPEQKAIAEILSSLDSKIELNNEMNKKLEEMAQTLYKRWLVDFEFPNEDGQPYKSSGGEMVCSAELGYEIPTGWRDGTLGDYAKVKSGYAFKSEDWSDSGVPVIKIKDLQNDTINFNDIAFVDEGKKIIANNFLVNQGDILIAMTGATLGKIGLVPKFDGDILVNQRVGKFFLGDEPLEKIGYLYMFLKQNEVYNYIVGLGSGSAQANISPGQIESVKITIPEDRVLEGYNKITKDIIKKITDNIYENGKLTNLRDTLLPKLVSGEIRVQ